MHQGAFLIPHCREMLYGGAAGGGKSEALLMAALQYVDLPGYSAILFRRTYSDLALPGALMDRAGDWLRPTNARWSERSKKWTFPSGATLAFGYLDHPKQKYRYQSAEFQFIGFDELTQFAESEYTYLFSRLRRLRKCRIPLRMRAASNPGGLGHDWVRRRFILEGRDYGRAFIPARLSDNPHLDRAQYELSLAALDPVTRAQLLDGDWDQDDDRLLDYETIISCQAECLWTAAAGTEPTSKPAAKTARTGTRSKPPARTELYVGVDVGRSHDLSVIWTWEKIADVCWCREIKVLEKTTFAEQREAIEARLGRGVVKCAIDKGGIGCQLAEELERRHPGVVEGVQLTSGVQGRLAQRLAVGFGERRVRIPDDSALRDDLRLVRKTRVVGGISRVEADRGPVGHADRFWAAALGYDAALSFEPAPRLAASLPKSIARGARRRNDGVG